MESEEKLFELGSEVNLPIWDVVRYYVYIKYLYSEKDRERFAVVRSRSLSDYVYFIISILIYIYRIITDEGKNVIIACSRSCTKDGKLFDKNAIQIIDCLAGKCLVLDPLIGKKLSYKYIYDLFVVFRRVYCTKPLPYEYYSHINKAITKHFGRNLITFNEVNSIYHNFQSDYKYYGMLFKFKNTKKVFIATGNPKGILLAAKEQKVNTYLLQHSLIEYDSIEHVYPKDISISSNLLFCDNVLTYGDYWCNGLNIPTKNILSIGNDLYFSKQQEVTDNSILVISTIIHGDELKAFTKQLSLLRPDLKIVYKLHQNEYHFYDKYVKYFELNFNVFVSTYHVDISKLISRSELVILIESGALYEALQNDKKVAVYTRLNYNNKLNPIDFPNLYYVDNVSEIMEVLAKPSIPSKLEFYKPTDVDLLKSVCSIDLL
jgi:hypothetical protein